VKAPKFIRRSFLNRKAPIAAAIFAVFLAFSAFHVFFALAAIEDSWTTKEPLPMASWGIVGVNDKIYAIAGSGDYANVSYVNNAVLEYDPASDEWTAKKPMPTKRYQFATTVYQNKIYVIGEPDGANQIYDPATDTWKNKTSMPTPRTQLEANVVNGKIYLIGGRTGGQYSTVGLNEVYDPETDSWTTKAPIPYPVVLYACAVVDNKIYIIGGQDEYTYPPNLNTVQIYDPETDTWSFGTPMPVVVWQAAAGATSGVWAPKRIYVIGGLQQTSMIGTDLNQVYDPASDTWTFGTPMPTARFSLHVAVVNDKIYAMGGSPYWNLQGLGSRENEQYTPVGYGTVPPKVSVASPENVNYTSSEVALNFTVNRQVEWMGYSLDGQETVTTTGNTTITGLSNGLHNVTVYAKDEFENTGVSETISFSVDVPFPTAPVAAASVAIIAVVGVGLLVYFKKRKR
jgi:N-acetylneuraminic acid mutarotase